MTNNIQKHSLFSLRVDSLRIMAIIEASSDDGELDAQLSADIETLGVRIEEKAEGYACLIGQLEATALARRTESKRIVELARIDEAMADRLRKKLKDFFIATGAESVRTATHNLRVQNAGGQRALDFSADATEEFLTYTPIPNKDLIRQALDGGRELPFVKFAPRQTVLVIK